MILYKNNITKFVYQDDCNHGGGKYVARDFRNVILLWFVKPFKTSKLFLGILGQWFRCLDLHKSLDLRVSHIF